MKGELVVKKGGEREGGKRGEGPGFITCTGFGVYGSGLDCVEADVGVGWLVRYDTMQYSTITR